MKICLVAESYPPALGGVEYALQKLVEGFIDRGNEVRVVSSSWQRHSPAMEKLGALTLVRVFTLPVFKRLWFILFSLPSVIRAVRWADVVQGSTFAGGPPAFFAGLLMGKKKALIVHEVFGRRWFELEPNVMRSLFYYVTEWIIVHLPFDHYVVRFDCALRICNIEISSLRGACLCSLLSLPCITLSHRLHPSTIMWKVMPVFSSSRPIFLIFSLVQKIPSFRYCAHGS